MDFKLYHKHITPWLIVDDKVIGLHKSGKPQGIISFYLHLTELSRGAEVLTDYPRLEELFSSNIIHTTGRKYKVDSPEYKETILFYIDFLKRGGYLEVIPRFEFVAGKIVTHDHLVVPPAGVDKLEIAPLMTWALNDAERYARKIMDEHYTVDTIAAAEAIDKGLPFYIRSLPYYYLMEVMRSRADLDPITNEGNFRTIRRDKQEFLNEIYNRLIATGQLIYDDANSHFKNLNNYFRYAWSSKPEHIQKHIQLHHLLAGRLVNDFLSNPESQFSLCADEDATIRELVKNPKLLDSIKEQYTPQTLNCTFKLLTRVLSTHQDDFFKEESFGDPHVERRFIRNATIELLMHTRVILSHLHLDKVTAQDWENFGDLKNLKRLTRRNDPVFKKSTSMSDMKKELGKSVNYQMLFTGSLEFDSASHTGDELMERYKKYRPHFRAIFPKLQNMKTPALELKCLLTSYVRTGLVIQVDLPPAAAKAGRKPATVFVENTFWANDIGRKAAAEDYREQYKYSKSAEKAYLNEWIHYLDLNARQANERTVKKKAKPAPAKAAV